VGRALWPFAGAGARDVRLVPTSTHLCLSTQLVTIVSPVLRVCVPLLVFDAATVAVAVLGARRVDAMFSEETRQHVLGLFEEDYTRDEVRGIMGCSKRSMRRWLKFLRDNGTVWRDPAMHNSHEDAAVRNPTLNHAILSLLQREPAAFLKDHVDLLVALSLDFPASDHRYVSASTVYRVLRRNNITRKRVERLFSERSETDQRAFAIAFNQIPLRCIISVDETHTQGSDMYRLYGRSVQGTPCVLYDRDTRPVVRTSTMMAVSMTHGVLWVTTVILGDAQTSDDWRLFLHGLRQQMNAYIPGLPWELQPDACVILYDNAGIHDVAGDAFMQANGMPFVRLPAYSPNLQPVEGVFNQLKRNVRDLVYQDSRFMTKPMRLMAAATAMLTQAQIAGQFVRISNYIAALLA